MEERLQKILAQAGHGSRRSCEKYIQAGRVRVNGQVAKLGQKADPSMYVLKAFGHNLMETLCLSDRIIYLAFVSDAGDVKSGFAL